MRGIGIARLCILAALPVWTGAPGAQAQETHEAPAPIPVLSCHGADPAWTLTIFRDEAIFELTRQVKLEIPLVTRAEGRDWPRAWSLIGRQDTVIAVIDRDICQLRGMDFPYSADILTQRASTAIVLTGCCAAPQG